MRPLPRDEGHLSSDELAQTCDLNIQVADIIFPVHSAVMASQSAILRSLFASTASDGHAAAVGSVFNSAPLPAVRLFLRLIYNPLHVKPAITAVLLGPPLGWVDSADEAEQESWVLKELLRLADQLDARMVLEAVADHYLVREGEHVLRRNWVHWLATASQLRMHHLHAKCLRGLLLAQLDPSQAAVFARSTSPNGQPHSPTGVLDFAATKATTRACASAASLRRLDSGTLALLCEGLLSAWRISARGGLPSTRDARLMWKHAPSEECFKAGGGVLAPTE